MPRNSSGTYTLPAGNPVVPNTLIETTWANPTMSDIGSALTDSLDRQGRGAMSAPLKLTDGTAVAPALSFSSESTSGLYRVAAGVLGFAIAGVLAASISAAGFVPVGQFLANLGTAALPGYAFIGDTNTGMSAQVADTLVLSTAGLARHSISSVGAHTLPAATAGTTLTVTNLFAQPGIKVTGDGSSEYMLWLSSTGGATTGRVGLYFERIGGTGKAWAIGNDTDGGTDNSFDIRDLTRNVIPFAVSTTGNVTIAAPSAGTALAVQGSAVGDIITARNTGNSFQLSFGTTATTAYVDAGNATSGLALTTQGSANVRVAIGNNGNVTINAPSSGTALTVNGNADAVVINSTGATVRSNHVYQQGAAVAGYVGADGSQTLVTGSTNGDMVVRGGGGSAGRLRFVTAAGGGSTQMLIDTGGNVTIAAPSSGDTLAIGMINGARGLYVSGGLAGGIVQTKTENGSNTASSDARHIMTVGGTSAGDPYWVAEIPGGTSWAFGARNAASDSFQIKSATSLSGGQGIVIEADGRLWGTNLHNNGGSVTGTTSQYIASGTYTPTFTNSTNTSTFTSTAFKWMRVGNVVTVSGQVSLTTAAGSASPGTASEFTISLPIASNISNSGELAGAIQCLGASNTNIMRGIFGNTGSDVADCNFGATAANNQAYLVIFTYEVL